MNITIKVTSEELEKMELSADSLQELVIDRLDDLAYIVVLVEFNVSIDEI